MKYRYLYFSNSIYIFIKKKKQMSLKEIYLKKYILTIII